MDADLPSQGHQQNDDPLHKPYARQEQHGGRSSGPIEREPAQRNAQDGHQQGLPTLATIVDVNIGDLALLKLPEQEKHR